LAAIDDARAVEPLRYALENCRDYSVCVAAAEAFRAMGPERGLAPLVAALESRAWPGALRAAEELGNLGDLRAVGALVTGLNDDSTRHEAARSLGKLKSDEAVEPLISQLLSGVGKGSRDASDLDFLSTCASALGRIGCRRAVDPLISVLNSAPERVGESVARSLGVLGDPKAVGPLIAALDNRRTDVWEGAILALGKLGDRQAIEPLTSVLREFAGTRARTVCTLAATAIAAIGGPGALASLLDHSRLHDVADALIALADPGAAALIKNLNARKPEACQQGLALYICVGLRDPASASEIFGNPTRYLMTETQWESGRYRAGHTEIGDAPMLLAHALRWAPGLASDEQLAAIEQIKDLSYEAPHYRDIEPYSTGSHDWVEDGVEVHTVSYEDERRLARNERMRRDVGSGNPD